MLQIENLTDEAVKDWIASQCLPNALEYASVPVFAVLLFCGLVGNFMVIFVVIRNANMRTATNIFLVNLAAADFLVLLFCLPPTILWDITKTWWFDTIACKAMMYCQNVAITVSVLTLVAISVERWYAICNPLRFKITHGWTRRILATVWFTGLILGLPEPIWDRARTHEIILNIQKIRPNFTTTWGQICGPPWDHNILIYYQWAILVVLFLIPLTVIAVLYGLIAHVLWAKAVPSADRQQDSGAKKCLTKTNTETNIHSTHEKQMLGRRKAAKMLIAVVVLFTVCYFPVHLYNLLQLYGYISITNHYVLALCKLLIRFLSYFNSCVNPIIYNFMSEKFQREFRRACCWSNYGSSDKTLSKQESAALLSANKPSKNKTNRTHLNISSPGSVDTHSMKNLQAENSQLSSLNPSLTTAGSSHVITPAVARKTSDDSVYQL